MNREKKHTTTSEGTLCGTCGSKTRYASGSCVACTKRRAKKRRELYNHDKRELGVKFEGNQCSKCGSTLRYTGNRKCVRCEQAYNQTAERKTYNKTYNQKPERKAANARSKQSPRTKATIKAHFESLRGRSVYLWTHARQRASVKGLPFTITKQTVYDRLVSLNGIAEVTFCTLDLKTRYDVQKNPYAPSLDQRIPGRGYTPENFQIVTDWYNRFKNDLCDDEATGILDQYALNKQFRAA